MIEHTLNRDEWQALCARVVGPPADDASTVIRSRPGSVDIDFEDGVSEVGVYFSPAATDIRIGDLQFLVGRDRLVVIRCHPPFPIKRWTVIYDGPLPKDVDRG